MYLSNHLVVRAAASAPSRESVAQLLTIIIISPGRSIATAPSERRAYRSDVSVVEGDIADQRSSKLAVGSSFASTVRPFDIVVPAETTIPSEGECDLMLAAVAATASRATATNPVIVRCLVIRTSCGPESPLAWVTGTSRRFNGNMRSPDRTDLTTKLSRIQNGTDWTQCANAQE
jgi:hypothetical protein